MSSNSSKDLQQEAVGNGLAHQLQKRHSSGEHVNLQIKFQASDELKLRRQSSPVLQGQHIISLHHGTSKATASGKPTPPPHPTVSPELAKLLKTHKSHTSTDIHVIDSRSKNAPQVCNSSSVPHKSTKCPPKRPDPPKQPPHQTHAYASTVHVPAAPDPPKNSPNPPTPPPPTPSPPPPTTCPTKSKRVPARRAPPPPSEKASLKTKAASGHKSYERVSLNDKETSPPNEKAPSKVKGASGHKIYEKSSKNDKASSKTKATSDHKTHEKVHKSYSSNEKATSSEKACSNEKATHIPKKISMDSKIAPLLEQFEKACSNSKVAPIQMPGALYTAATKPQTSSIPKSQSTDILSPEKPSFPKSQSTDLLSPTSSTIPKSQSTDLLKPQLPKSQSSTALKTKKSVIPKSRSSAVLKSQKSSLPKQNTPTPKKDTSSLKQEAHAPTSKPPSKTWKPKNSKLQALFHKAERRKRKKTKEEKVAETHHDQEAKHAEEAVRPTEAKHASEEDFRPLEAIYAVVQKINMDDSLTPQTAAAAVLSVYDKQEQSSQTPGCWIPPEEVPPTSKDPNCEDKLDSQNSRKISLDGAKFTVGPQYSQEDLYASLKKFRAKPEEETLPPIRPRFYENVFDDPSITDHNSQVRDMEREPNHNLKAQLQESMDNTYAVMHNPRNKGYGDTVAMSSEQEELPPLPPRLYENVFDDPIIAEHAEQRNFQSNDTKHDLQESMDNTYAVMHNPRSKGNNDNSSRMSGEQEELPPLPPKKLYVNIFDDPIAFSEHKNGTAKAGDSDQVELPPPLPPKLYENIFDDPSVAAEHTVGNSDANTGSEQDKVPPPLPPKMYENVFDDQAGSAKHGAHGGGRRHEVATVQERSRGTALINGATSQDSKAQLQESADNTYAVMHNPRSKDKGESAKSSEQEDIYIVMHPHPVFMPLIKKYFKNPKSK